MKILILGAGYSGSAIGKAFVEQGATVWGTTRSADKHSSLSEAGLHPLQFDGETMSEELLEALDETTHLIQSIAPGHRGDPFVRLLNGDIRTAAPNLAWISYLSTVGVYGDHGGAWVDEETPCRPVSARSVERVEAERAWTTIADTSGLPLAILRLSGIYGPGRNGFVNLSKNTAKRIVKKGQVFNRVRVEDIAGATLFLSERKLGGVFNVTDDEPAPPQDVVAEAARLMGVPPPPEQDFETAQLSPLARSFYGENKRVSNSRIRTAGYEFRFPNYRLSLEELCRDLRWNKIP